MVRSVKLVKSSSASAKVSNCSRDSSWICWLKSRISLFCQRGRVGLENEQELHHFLTSSPWLAKDLKERRLKLILSVLGGREITIIIDETGDNKKGKTTDYVKRQYIGNIGKVENGIVSVNAYGLIEGMTIPLISEVYKPKERLKEGDTYKSKPEIAAGIVKSFKSLALCFLYSSTNSLLFFSIYPN